MSIKLVAYISPDRMHELDEPSGYWSHDDFPDKVAQLCHEFSLPYSARFVSIAVFSGTDEVHQAALNTMKAYGTPVLLKSDAVLPLITIVCSDDIQNVAVYRRGHEVLLEDLSGESPLYKAKMLGDAVTKKSNASYAEARIFDSLKRKAHVDRLLSREENDPFSQLGLWPNAE